MTAARPRSGRPSAWAQAGPSASCLRRRLILAPEAARPAPGRAAVRSFLRGPGSWAFLQNEDAVSPRGLRGPPAPAPSISSAPLVQPPQDGRRCLRGAAGSEGAGRTQEQ